MLAQSDLIFISSILCRQIEFNMFLLRCVSLLTRLLQVFQLNKVIHWFSTYWLIVLTTERGKGEAGGRGGAYEFREHESIRDKWNGKQKTERTFDSVDYYYYYYFFSTFDLYRLWSVTTAGKNTLKSVTLPSLKVIIANEAIAPLAKSQNFTQSHICILAVKNVFSTTEKLVWTNSQNL